MIRTTIRALAAATALALAACSANPVTGRSQLLLVDDAALAQSAAQAWADLKARTPISRDPQLNAQVRRVGLQVVQANQLPGEWEFVVFDTPEVNAFVLPGGKVGVYRGLLRVADTDAQLAAVLGHEIAHTTLRHAAERASQAGLAQLGAQTLGSDLATQVFGLGVQYGVLNPYSRLQEAEADRVGVDYLARAGYDARAAVSLWGEMAQASQTRPPEFLSTHPDPVRRMQELDAYIQARGY